MSDSKMPDELFISVREDGLFIGYPMGFKEPYIRQASVRVPDNLAETLKAYPEHSSWSEDHFKWFLENQTTIIEAARELLRLAKGV